jgi:helicase
MYLRKGDIPWLDKEAEQFRKEFLLEVPDQPDEYEWFLADLKLACLLRDWMDEKGEEDITDKYDVGPGDIRAKVETGRWILYSMREMARLFGYPCASAIDRLHRRVEEGVREELLGLVTLRGIGRVRARALYNSGYHTLEELGRAGTEKLSRVPKIGPVVAEMIMKQIAPSKGDGHNKDEGENGKKSYFD